MDISPQTTPMGVQAILRPQSGDSQFITLSDTQTLLESVSQHLSMSPKDFREKYYLVVRGDFADEVSPTSIVEGESILLLTRKRKDYLKEPSDDAPLDLESMIQEKMKKYAAPDIVIDLDEDQISMLMDMGFPRVRVEKALTITSSDAEEALNWLLSHTDDPNADTPLTQKELRRIVRTQENFTPDESKLQNLIEMGFERERAIHALKFSNNSFDGAVAWLTGDSAPPVPAGIPNIFGDPRIADILREVAADPERINHYLADPEFGPLIRALLINQPQQ